jgi:hypothetical protein
MLSHLIKFRCVTSALCVLILFQASEAFGATQNLYQKSPTNQLEIINLLIDSDYKKLEALLEKYQKNYERDKSNEMALYYAYQSFSNNDQDLESQLNAWVKTSPQSYIPRLARGSYFLNKEYRESYRKKSLQADLNLKTKAELDRRAENDFKAGISMYPKSLAGYTGLQALPQLFDSPREQKQILMDGLKLHPGSVTLRQIHLFYTQMNEGGNQAEVSLAMQDIRAKLSKYPNLKILLNYEDFLQAEKFADEGRYREAVPFYQKALLPGDYFYYRINLANAYFKDQQYQNALVEINRALNAWPQERRGLALRARTYIKLRQCDKALPDIKLILSIDACDACAASLLATCEVAKK